MKTCRCCGRAAKLVGVYCPKCMQGFREQYAHARQMRAYYRALDFGAGDLWRLR